MMLKVDVVPMGAPRQTQRDRWARRPVIVRYHGYKDELRLKLPGYELPREVMIEFHLPMPKSWSKKKRAEMVGEYHDQKPDIDNLCKAFMDVWKDGEDDKVVHSLTARKFWAEEGYIVLF
jgi:Holliday junction resolvase RusA-like endonuclease